MKIIIKLFTLILIGNVCFAQTLTLTNNLGCGAVDYIVYAEDNSGCGTTFVSNPMSLGAGGVSSFDFSTTITPTGFSWAASPGARADVRVTHVEIYNPCIGSCSPTTCATNVADCITLDNTNGTSCGATGSLNFRFTSACGIWGCAPCTGGPAGLLMTGTFTATGTYPTENWSITIN